MNAAEKKMADRFITYAKIDSQSRAGSLDCPSRLKELDMARYLEKELITIGLSNVHIGKGGVVYGYIPGNIIEKEIPVIGFNAHYDTSPDAPGSDVKPWVCEKYAGGDVVLNKEKNIVLKVERFPNMPQYAGQDMIFSDGTTLLGGDDKAAITSIVTAAEYLILHPEIKHGDISIAFTPDEEVGRGTENFDIPAFGAKYCYTVDGDSLGYYTYETFNGEEAQLHFKGLSVHPGVAKGKMINAVEIAGEFMSMLPAQERPQTTEKREGYFHPFALEATVEKAYLRCLIRDHELLELEKRHKYIEHCLELLNNKYGAGTVTVEFVNKYYSMREVIRKVPFMLDYLKQAMRDSGVEPEELPLRGGTDGSWLSQMGMPTPNISAGYENAHGVFECVSIQTMLKNVEIIIRLAEIYAKQG